jgi:hypothetical protein
VDTLVAGDGGEVAERGLGAACTRDHGKQGSKNGPFSEPSGVRRDTSRVMAVPGVRNILALAAVASAGIEVAA